MLKHDYTEQLQSMRLAMDLLTHQQENFVYVLHAMHEQTTATRVQQICNSHNSHRESVTAPRNEWKINKTEPNTSNS
jgi:hypothetical protein